MATTLISVDVIGKRIKIFFVRFVVLNYDLYTDSADLLFSKFNVLIYIKWCMQRLFALTQIADILAYAIGIMERFTLARALIEYI